MLLFDWRQGGETRPLKDLCPDLMETAQRPRLYSDLAVWWPLFSPPAHYLEEAEDLLPHFIRATDPAPRTMLELGSGGGSLAWHLKARFTLTLTDLSPEMIAMSRAVNPECEHLVSDMRLLDLGREFDLVLVHDAVMYLTEPESVQRCLAAAARHCRPGGAVFVIPDCVRETYQQKTECGGEDGADGRGLRYVEWDWDPDPSDQTFETAFAFLLRETDGTVRCDTDLHRFGLFPRQSWLDWITEAGLVPSVRMDRWDRDVFLGRKPPV